MITKVSQLTCDTCGHSDLLDDSETTLARINAMKKGWSFMAYQGLMVNGRARARQYDACPNCELPAPTELAAKMSRKAPDFNPESLI